MSTVPTGLRSRVVHHFPTLKRGANKRCASGAAGGGRLRRGRWMVRYPRRFESLGMAIFFFPAPLEQRVLPVSANNPVLARARKTGI